MQRRETEKKLKLEELYKAHDLKALEMRDIISKEMSTDKSKLYQ